MLLRHAFRDLFGSGSGGKRRRRAAELIAPAGAEVLESRRLLAAAVANMTLSLSTTAITLASTDIYDPTVSIVRSGTSLTVTAGPNTQLTYNGVVKTSQTINLGSTVRDLTVNLGGGENTVSINGVDATSNLIKNVNLNLGTGLGTVGMTGVSTTGNVNITGQSTGDAEITINAASPDATHPTVGNTVIGGSVIANFGSAAATLNLFGSKNFGGNLTVTGSVNILENGAGAKQINLAGPLANNPSGGKLFIGGNLSVVDQGSGVSGLLIDDGVTITGNVKFDNSVNTTSSNTLEIYSNSLAYGVTTIGGTVTANLSSATYAGSNVTLQGFGAPLTFAGTVNVTSGAGADTITLANTLFKSTAAVNSGSNPSFERDLVTINGSTFNLGTTVSSVGAFAELDIGTDSTFAATVFKSTFSASLTGPSSLAVISNGVSTTSAVVFNSTATFTGGNPVGYLNVKGPWTIGTGKLQLVNFTRTAPTAVKANVTMSVANGMVTLTSTDRLNHTVTVTRSGSHVVVTAGANTQITYNGVAKTSQSVFLQTLAGLTINLGTGLDTVTVSGLSMTGNLAINGQTTGKAAVTVNADAVSATIGGSINANFGGTSGTLNVYSSSVTGPALTVNGSVNVTESSGGQKQVNLAGPISGNPGGQPLVIKGGVTVTDTGMGASGLHIDDGVKITGSVSFDNSINTVNGSTVGVYSNSTVYGVTSIGGSLTAKLAKAGYSGNSFNLQGFGNAPVTPLTITGAVSVTSGSGADDIVIGNTLFKSTVSIDSSGSPNYLNDYMKIDGSTFTLAATLASSGYYAQLDIGTDPSYVPTVFSKAFAAYLTGPSSVINVSNPTSASSQVNFGSSVTLVGGNPAGTMFIKGRWSVNSSLIKTTNFSVVTV